MRQPNVLVQRLFLLVTVVVATFSLSSCCFFLPWLFNCPPSGLPYGVTKTADGKSAANQHRVPEKHFARQAGLVTQDSGASTPTLAPFYGNTTFVTTTSAPQQAFLMARLPDCSLTYGEFSSSGSVTSPVITVNTTTPDYGQIIHNNSFLTTTPGVYPNGCGATTQGAASGPVAYLGQAKMTGDYLNAGVASNSIVTYGVNTSYAVTAGATLTPDIAPYSILAADLNKDGNLDLISGNTDGLNSSVSVWISNGDGTYKANVNYELTGQVISFFVADDLDGDGNVDVLINVENQGFKVLFGKGDGTLKPAVSITTGGGPTSFFTDKFITADVNGDNKRDIITSEGQVFLGTGDGITYTYPGLAFPPTVNPSNGLAPGIVAADFNNDGKIDIAIDSGNTIATYIGDGTGQFTVGPAYATLPNRGLITGTDIDGDGNLDLYSGFANASFFGGDDYIPTAGYALLGKGDGSFAGAPVLPIVYTGTNLLDLNGDGRPDLVGSVVTGSTTSLVTYLTGADGIPVAGPQIAIPNTLTLDSYATGAFNTKTNKTPGLIWLDGNPNGQLFHLYLGAGDGSFDSPTTFPAPALVPAGNDINQQLTGLHLADFDGDGVLDIAYSFTDQSSTSQTYYEGLAVQLGNGDGTFGPPQITYTYQSTTKPVQAFGNLLSFVADVNKDGFADAFMIVPPTALGNPYTVQLFVGNGNGLFHAPNTLNVTPTVFPPTHDGRYGTPFALADLNGDGKLDLVTGGSSADSSTPEIAITLGNGDGTFQPPTILKLGGFGFAGSPALADFDGDGKIDLYMGGVIEGAGLGVFPGKGDGTFNAIANIDGTVSAPDAVFLSAGGGAVGVDLNNDKLADLIVGGVIFINKSNVTPPVQAATSTALTSSLNPSTVGASVTFTATVTSATAGTITGSVNFFDGATQLGTGTVSAGGVATYQNATFVQGTHSITAVYGGDSNYATSTSPAVSQVVNATGGSSPTTTTITSSLNPSTVGANVTFTASVVGSANPTGTVTFKDGSTTLGSGTLSSGIATFSTSTLAQGTHTITAVYAGDANNASSTGTLGQIVNAATSKAATATALVSSLNPSTSGTNVVFTATVTSTTAGAITGTVSFFDGGTLLRNATIGAGGVALFQSTTLAQGTHVITAQYLGDSTGYATSTSPAVSQVVNAAAGKAATSTALSASSTNAVSGTNITFTATVTSTTAGTISGSVAFLDGGTQIGTGTVGAGGVATYSNSTFSVGLHTITASYGGDTNYATSTSSATQVTITAAGGSFTVAASPSSVTVSAKQTATTQVSVTPTGGFNAAVTFSCAGLAGATCTFSPASVTPNGGPATTTLTIGYNPNVGTLGRTSSALLSPNGEGTGGTNGNANGATFNASRSAGATALALSHPRSFALLFGGELFALVLLSARRKREHFTAGSVRASNGRRVTHGAARLAYAVLLCAIAITAMAGCTGGGAPSTGGTLTVTATSGATVVSTPINIIIKN